MTRKRVGIVGSGISGLTAAWIFKHGKSQSGDNVEYDVDLFEKDSRFGGHTWSVEHTDERTGEVVELDLGFQVFNLTNYGNLVEMFECLRVESQPSVMSFSYSRQSGESSERSASVEWSSNNGIFGIFNNLLRDLWNKDKWLLTKDLIRFEREAEGILTDDTLKSLTLEEWLVQARYSEAFADHYIYPMCGAIWSSGRDQVKKFPIVWLARFICNHHLHLITSMQRPLWRVVKHGSKTYVDKLVESLEAAGGATTVSLHHTCPVHKVVHDRKRKVFLLHYAPGDGKEVEVKEVDLLILATHTDTTKKMVFDWDRDEAKTGHLGPFKAVVGAIDYVENTVVLHRDKTWMPVGKRSWTSWNLLERETATGREETINKGKKGAVCISYWANTLASLPSACADYFVTLNPWKGVGKAQALMESSLAHPQFSLQAQRAQEMLKTINGNDGLFLCGAWCGYGFHEDGVRSAVDVCSRLGLLTPWHYQERQDHLDNPASWTALTDQYRPLDPSVSARQTFFMFLFEKYMSKCIRKGFIRLILPSGHEMTFGDPENVHDIHTHVLEQRRRGPKSKVEEECVCRKRVKAEATLRVFDLSVFEAIVVKSDIGLGESFFQGKFAVDDLFVLLSILSQNLTALNASTNKWILGIMNFFGSKVNYVKWLLRSNTIRNSRKNIEEHYDAGNDMYKAFLDSRMVYSSAIYTQDDPSLDGEDSSVLTWDSLETVQMRKLCEVAERCGVEEGDRVLEVGCGWGAMAILLATKYKCRYTGITLSTEQLEECKMRAQEAKVGHLCTFLLCDYRKIPVTGELYDRIISIEMIEAVGHEYFASYFEAISTHLKPGGLFAIQAISYPDYRYDSQLYTSDFIKQHIFPGGHLPCMKVMKDHALKNSLHLRDYIDIGKSYAITLMKWRENWVRSHKIIRKLGYSQDFWRKYLFYFVYCETGFNEGLIVDYIATWEKV